MKICFVITQGEMGGAQRYVFDLATGLAAQGEEILVLVGAEKTELKSRLKRAGIPCGLVKNLVRSINPIRDIAAVFELTSKLREYHPDIVHLSSSKAGVIGSVAARLAKIPNVVFTAHGFAFLEPNSRFVNRLYFWAEKIASNYRKAIITVSEFDRQAAIAARLCPPEKLITIHNGVDWDKIEYLPQNRARAALQLEPDKFIIGTVANFYRTKGLPYLISAARELVTDYPETQFFIVGDGTERSKLLSQIKSSGLENSVLLVNPQENVRQFLKAFDLFVLPSVKEGFPYVILEAMAAGLPIVATKTGGIPEAIRNGQDGLLVEPKNPAALASAISKLIKNPSDAKKLGQMAEERAKNFTYDAMLAATCDVYRSLVSSRKRFK
ncbi:glycosyltransferase family 1 protein [bacterium]|nr:MAG: glycosyltransferase family 1 protein [bacterium]